MANLNSGWISRRLFLRGAGGFVATAAGLGSYALAEPVWRLGVTSYALTPPRWPAGLKLKVAVVADIHACEPWMGAGHIAAIVDLTNALAPDLTVLLGDFNGAHGYVTGPVMPDTWGAELARLRARHGVFSVLGNHDWWHGALPSMRADKGEGVRAALRGAGIGVLENDARRIVTPNGAFWLAGLGDQMVARIGRGRFQGIDDLPGTLRQVKDEAPVLLLAHEPFIFPQVPDRVSLTLCGHTHGGQVYLPGIGAPAISTRNGRKYVYGHYEEEGRHMIISGGLGTSIMPVRFMRPPEVLEVMLGG